MNELLDSTHGWVGGWVDRTYQTATSSLYLVLKSWATGTLSILKVVSMKESERAVYFPVVGGWVGGWVGGLIGIDRLGRWRRTGGWVGGRERGTYLGT